MTSAANFPRQDARPGRGTPGAARVRVVLAVSALALAGCAGTSPAPEPGQSRGVPPDLRGSRVILLPVQHVVGIAGDPDAELVFTLTDRGSEVDWILADEMDEALARSPAVQTRTRGLPVSAFLQAEVRRVGDPLYGELRRMAVLVDADAIILPVTATFEPNPALPDGGPRVRFTTALIDPRSGRVVWYGVEEGGEFPRNDPRGLASAVERLASTLFWYVAR